MDLAQVIADWRGDAAVLRRRGQSSSAELLERCAIDAQAAAEEYLVFLTESEAALYSGETTKWLAKRFIDWERRGHGQRAGRTRLYRQCVLPRRAQAVQAFEAGRQAARDGANRGGTTQ